MLKRKVVIVLMVILVAASAFYVANSDMFNKSNPYETEVFSIENGYGYQIKYNAKLLIKQNYIPAINLNKTFCTAEDADRVARLVSQKLYNKENPQITLENLNQLNVNLNCNN